MKKDRSILAWVVPVVVVAAAFAAFLPALNGEFLGWDDNINFTQNLNYRGLGLKQIRWALLEGYFGNFQPLTWLTHGADYLLWGMNPSGYHLANFLIHACGAWVFYLVSLRLLKLAAPESSREDLLLAAGFSALFFAIHPLRVESVAWITERRDVLSGVFYLLTILWYLRSREEGSGWSLPALCAYILSLLSKAIGMTLPVVLIVLDIYPLKRLSADPRQWASPAFRGIWREKLPYMALAAAFAVMALLGQWNAQANVPLEKFGMVPRIVQASYAAVFYVWKTLLPLGLSPLYENPAPFDPLAWRFVLSSAAFAAFLLSLAALRRRWPALLAAGAVFLVSMAPVSGLLRVGPHLAADRYTYVSCMPWAVLLGGALMALLRKRRGMALAGAGAVLAALFALTWEQSKVWVSTEALWRRALAVDPRTALASNNLGVAAGAEGRTDEAVQRLREAIRIKPDYAEAFDNLGAMLLMQGKREEAEVWFRAALKLHENMVSAHNHLGAVLALTGRPWEAIGQYRWALSLSPQMDGAQYNLGLELAAQGRKEEAIYRFLEALRLRPDNHEARNNLGLLLGERGRFLDAVEQYRAALRSNPRYAVAHYNWGNALTGLGRNEEAARHYREALRLDPANIVARFNLGNALARQGRTREAIKQYQEVLKRRPDFALAWDSLRKVSALLER